LLQIIARIMTTLRVHHAIPADAAPLARAAASAAKSLKERKHALT